VLEAFTWATADDQIGTELEHRPRGVVALIYEVLNRGTRTGRAQMSCLRRQSFVEIDARRACG
jgi:hypothetical protein